MTICSFNLTIRGSLQLLCSQWEWKALTFSRCSEITRSTFWEDKSLSFCLISYLGSIFFITSKDKLHFLFPLCYSILSQNSVFSLFPIEIYFIKGFFFNKAEQYYFQKFPRFFFPSVLTSITFFHTPQNIL